MASTGAVFKEYYSKLVQTLPMSDATFVATLYSRNLLSRELKNKLNCLSEKTSAEKATIFLDSVIEPSVASDAGGGFDKLLSVMGESEYETVKELAEQVKTSVREILSNNDNEGALLIVKSAVDNGMCQHVEIDNEYMNDEVKKVINTLEDRMEHELLLKSGMTESIVMRTSSEKEVQDSHSHEGDSFEDIPLEELLLQSQCMESIVDERYNSKSEEEVQDSYSDDCCSFEVISLEEFRLIESERDNSRSEGLVDTLPIEVGDGPIVSMENSLMNETEGDYHSGDIKGFHGDQKPS